jgi:hypothetical protein
MSHIYPELIQLDQPIPVHLTSMDFLRVKINIFFQWFVEDIFGSMMTYLEKDVLPFPHVKGIDLGPTMKRLVGGEFIDYWSFLSLN